LWTTARSVQGNRLVDQLKNPRHDAPASLLVQHVATPVKAFPFSKGIAYK
jgi:hypothetical protein